MDKEDEKGNTLLIVAAQNCNQKMCEMLLRRKADINHQNINGNTALHFAMAYDQKVRRHVATLAGDDTAAEALLACVRVVGRERLASSSSRTARTTPS